MAAYAVVVGLIDPANDAVFWPESAELELCEQLEVNANYDGLLLQPFISTREVEEARPDVSEDTIMHLP